MKDNFTHTVTRARENEIMDVHEEKIRLGYICTFSPTMVKNINRVAAKMIWIAKYTK
jgi:hypothetical protein